MDPDDFDAELAWEAVLLEALEVESTVWEGDAPDPATGILDGDGSELWGIEPLE